MSNFQKQLMLTSAIVGNLMAATGFWVVYCYFGSGGWGVAILSFLLLSFVYKFGPAPLFAISASLLHFKFAVVGFWLPVVSYVLAGFMLGLQLYLSSKHRAD